MVMDAGHINEINFQRDEVDLNDETMNPFSSTVTHNLVSYTERMLPVEVLHAEPTYMRALFTVNRHHSATTRSVYTILDLVGDVGALYDSLNLIWAFVLVYIFRVAIFLENLVLTSVFRKRIDEMKYKTFSLSYLSWFTDACRNCCCRCCCWALKYKPTQNERIRSVGLRRIERELDAARFVRS